jgi:hypothetical protein
MTFRARLWIVASILASETFAAFAAGSTGDADEAPAWSARATIGPHAYSLAECLSLSDHNFPNLWAARARVAGPDVLPLRKSKGRV